jgi:hypothetical protein
MNLFNFERFQTNSTPRLLIGFLLIAVQGVLSSTFLYVSMLGENAYEYLFRGLVFVTMLAGLKMLCLLFFLFYGLYLKQYAAVMAIVLNLVLFAVVFALVTLPGLVIYIFHDFPD